MISKTNKEAQEAIRALERYKEHSDMAELSAKLNSFEEYLRNLCSDVSKKKPKDGFIYQWVFETNEKVINENLDSFCKANLFAATQSLKRILVKLPRTGLNNVFRRMLSDFICELKFFIGRFDPEQDYKWLVINTNTHLTNFYYGLAENIFWNGEPGENVLEKLTLATSAPFIVRQSIEYKIRRILGIDIVHITGKSKRIEAKVYFNVLKNNMKFYKTRSFDFDIIKNIYSWTHLYIHSGYNAEPWRTETALHYLNNFFYSGETSEAQSYSRYAAIEVQAADLFKLKSNTDKQLRKELNDNNIAIKWLIHPEVAIIQEKGVSKITSIELWKKQVTNDISSKSFFILNIIAEIMRRFKKALNR